jgi:hypothetical protein
MVTRGLPLRLKRPVQAGPPLPVMKPDRTSSVQDPTRSTDLRVKSRERCREATLVFFYLFPTALVAMIYGSVLSMACDFRNRSRGLFSLRSDLQLVRVLIPA